LTDLPPGLRPSRRAKRGEADPIRASRTSCTIDGAKKTPVFSVRLRAPVSPR